MTTKLAVVEGLRMPQLEMIKARIKERLQATGLSANEASRRANLGVAYVNDILSGRSKSPVIDRLARLAAVLGCDVDFLLGNQDMPVRGEVVNFPSSTRQEDSGLGRNLPLFSVSLTDPDGFFSMNDDETGRFNPMTLIEGDANSYSVSVADDLMSPRFLPGEIVIVNTRKPIVPGACAVVRLNDDRALIRRVVAITATEIELVAIKTGDRMKIARANLKAIHRIISSLEG